MVKVNKRKQIALLGQNLQNCHYSNVNTSSSYLSQHATIQSQK